MEPQSPVSAQPESRALANGSSADHRPSARVFIGIKIASEIAREFANIAIALEDPSVRFVPCGDIHLTLVAPWNEENVGAAAAVLAAALQPVSSFDLTFERLNYGPTAMAAKFLWVECSATNELDRLQKLLLSTFRQTSGKLFRPHVTLARLGKIGCKIARKYPMDRPLSFRQRVKSIELFGSAQQQGRGYEIIASIPLHEETPPADGGFVSEISRHV